jgi:inhibitor of KinA
MLLGKPSRMLEKIVRLSETHLMIYLGDRIDPSLVHRLAVLTQRIQNQFGDKIIEVIPSYTSIMMEFHPLRIDERVLLDWLNQALVDLKSSDHTVVSHCVRLPVYYHPDVAPDLISLADNKDLSVEEVIAIHSAVEYTVFAIGFAPGFAFLGSVDDRISMPRHAEPRLNVAKGSVGIAGQQTAVYPLATPGGWQIIGNCPIDLFNLNQTPMMPFTVGDAVRFESVSRDAFIELGGKL